MSRKKRSSRSDIRTAGQERSQQTSPQATQSIRTRLTLLIAIAVLLTAVLVVRSYVTKTFRGASGGGESRVLDDLLLPPLPVPEGGELPETPTPEQEEIFELRQEAVRVVSDLLEEFPTSPDAVAVLGQLQYRLGNSEQSLNCWQRCLELDPGYFDAYTKMAYVARERGDYEAAEQYLRQRLSHEADSIDARIELCDVLIQQGKTDGALRELRELRGDSPPSSAAVVVLRGQAYLQQGEYDKAKQEFLQAVQIAPDFPKGYYGLSSACARLGERESARHYREEFEERKLKARLDDLGGVARDVSSMRQAVCNAYTAAGRVYALHGSTEKAERSWQTAAKRAPTDISCRLALYSLYDRSGDLDKALTVLRSLEMIEPKQARYPMLIGQLHVKSADFEAAEAAFRRACDVEPDQSAGFAALAQLYLRTGEKLSEALSLARQACDLEPLADNYYVLSVAAYRNGQASVANKAIQQALQLDPENATFHQWQQRVMRQP